MSVTGAYTREAGISAYFEICKSVTNVVYDNNLKVPHGIVSGQTEFYDNKQSVADKCQWVLDNNIGGAFTWDATMDDFNGQFCSEGKFPLITTAMDTLNKAGTTIQSTTIASSTSSSSTTTASTLSSSTISSSSTAKPLYATDCTGLTGTFGYQADCSKYVVCNNNQMTVYTCPTGTLFSVDRFMCDWPANVVCPGKILNSF